MEKIVNADGTQEVLWASSLRGDLPYLMNDKATNVYKWEEDIERKQTEDLRNRLCKAERIIAKLWSKRNA